MSIQGVRVPGSDSLVITWTRLFTRSRKGGFQAYLLHLLKHSRQQFPCFLEFSYFVIFLLPFHAPDS